MREQLDNQMWAEHHDAFSASFHNFIGKVMDSFKALTRINYNAPWAAQKVTQSSSRI